MSFKWSILASFPTDLWAFWLEGKSVWKCCPKGQLMGDGERLPKKSPSSLVRDISRSLSKQICPCSYRYPLLGIGVGRYRGKYMEVPWKKMLVFFWVRLHVYIYKKGSLRNTDEKVKYCEIFGKWVPPYIVRWWGNVLWAQLFWQLSLTQVLWPRNVPGNHPRCDKTLTARIFMTVT